MEWFTRGVLAKFGSNGLFLGGVRKLIAVGGYCTSIGIHGMRSQGWNVVGRGKNQLDGVTAGASGIVLELAQDGRSSIAMRFGDVSTRGRDGQLRWGATPGPRTSVPWIGVLDKLVFMNDTA